MAMILELVAHFAILIRSPGFRDGLTSAFSVPSQRHAIRFPCWLIPVYATRFFHRALNPSQASATTRGIGLDPVR
jgi:hypothetical protein